MSDINDVFKLFTPSVADALIQLINDGTFSQKQFDNWKDTLRGGLSGAPAWLQVEIVSDAITFQRGEKFTWLQVDTEGDVSSDDLNTITGTGQKDGDILFIVPNASGRIVEVRDNEAVSGNIFLKTINATMQLNTGYNLLSVLVLFYYDGKYMEIGRFLDLPADSYIFNELKGIKHDVIVSSGAIAPEKSNVRIEGEYTGDVQAVGSLTFAGTYPASGFLQVIVDEGTSSFVVGSTAFTSEASATTLAATVAAAVTLSGYTAANVGAQLDITAPAGRGKAANGCGPSINFVSITAGAPSYGTVVNFAGGVDGTPANDTIDTITTTFFDIPADRQTLLFLQNMMATGKYLKFVDTGNINIPGGTFYLRGGSGVLGMANSTSVDLLTPSNSGGIFTNTKHAVDGYADAAKTIYTVSVTGGSIAYDGTDPNSYMEFPDAADVYASWDFMCPENYVNGADVDVEIGFVDVAGAGAGQNFYVHFGGNSYEFDGGSQFDAPTLLSSDYLSAYATAETLFKNTYTMTQASYGFSAGDLFKVTIVREGTDGGDDAAGTLGVVYVKVKWPVW